MLAVDGVKPTDGHHPLRRVPALPPAVHLREHRCAEEEQGGRAVRGLLPAENLDRLVKAAKYVTLPASLEKEAADPVRGPHHRHRVQRGRRAQGRRPGDGAQAVAVSRLCRDGSACNMGGRHVSRSPLFCSRGFGGFSVAIEAGRDEVRDGRLEAQQPHQGGQGAGHKGLAYGLRVPVHLHDVRDRRRALRGDLRFFLEVSPVEFLTSTQWAPPQGEFGICRSSTAR